MNCKLNTRGIFCNRTLNLNSIRAIGYDMDYTLVHYHMSSWERRAYSYIKEGIGLTGWNLESLEFDPELAVRGLVIDTQQGNIVKANRFGYIKRAFHGTRPLEFEELRRAYQRTLVDLGESRWFFLSTLFSISEACIFMQVVDLFDSGQLGGCIGYEEIFRRVRHASDEAHMEGRLKSEILADPAQFVEPDEETPLALLDQKKSGKEAAFDKQFRMVLHRTYPDRLVQPFSAKLDQVARPVRHNNSPGKKTGFFHTFPMPVLR